MSINDLIVRYNCKFGCGTAYVDADVDVDVAGFSGFLFTGSGEWFRFSLGVFFV